MGKFAGLALPLLMLGTGVANAQDGSPPDQGDISVPADDGSGAPHGRGNHPFGQTFLSPAGEPFHSAMDGPDPMALWFAQADRNHDGKLDLDEFHADFHRFFATIDADHNGRADPFEIRDYENIIAPEVHALGDGFGRGGDGFGDGGQHRGGFGGGDHRNGRRGGGGSFGGASKGDRKRLGTVPTGGARYDILGLPEPVIAMDADVSGSVTTEEMDAAAADRFTKLDPQHLGHLTLEALPQSWAAKEHARIVARVAKERKKRGDTQ